MNRKVRLKHIAEALDISVTTVFRALKDGEGVNENTKKVIYDKAVELGYDFEMMRKSNNKKELSSIAIICPNDNFFKSVIMGTKAAIKDLNIENIKIDFKFLDAFDIAMQSEQLREIARSGKYDGIAITPSHPLMLNPIIDELVDKGTTVVTFNTDAPDSKRSLYIGQDSVIAGKMAAQILGLIYRSGGQVAYLTSFATTTCIRGRTTGFLNYINEYCPDINLIGPFEYYDDAEKAQQIAQQVIFNNPKVNIMCANNMDGTIGCAKAVESTGNAGKIMVIGFDNNDEINQFIKDDIITATILQDPFNQGYLTLKALVFEITGSKRNKRDFQYTSCSFLMKSNLDLMHSI